MRTISAVVSCDDCLIDGPTMNSLDAARNHARKAGFVVGIPETIDGWATGNTVDYCGPCANKRAAVDD